MSDIVQIIISIFGLIGIGAACARSGYVDQETGDRVADFVYKVPVPVLLAKNMATADFGHVSPWALWFCYFGGVVCVWILSHQLIRRLFGRDTRASVVAGVSAAFSNTVLIGIPVVQLAYGDAGLQFVVTIVAVHLPSLLAAGIVLNEWALAADGVRTGPIDRGALARAFAAGLFTNPVIYGIGVGVVWRLSGYTPFPALQILIDSLAGVAGPVALVSVGISVARFGATRQYVPALLISALKLLVMPAIVFGLAQFVGIGPVATGAAVLTAAAPAGISVYLIASRFGTGEALASNSIAISTALAIVTISLWLVFLRTVTG